MNIFKNVAVDIPNKSGFDMSHENFFSSYCGTLTPALIDTLLPGDKVDLSAIANVKLPPFASEFFGRIEFKMEAFFVPFRLLYGGWKEFITIPLDYAGVNTRPETSPFQHRKVSAVYLPTIEVTLHDSANNSATGQLYKGMLAAGSLADYLGYKIDADSVNASQSTIKEEINMLPFLAYHKIWDDWYRDSRLVSSCFSKPNNEVLSVINYPVSAAMVPYLTLSSTTLAGSLTDASTKLVNYGLSYQGSVNATPSVLNLFDLRQRSFDKDYFTNATPLPQAGNQQSVGFTISNNQGSFSIASLRAANSIQTWLERNNLAGDRYPDQIKANFGVYPADGITDRCIYLGRVNVPVYSKSVYQTAEHTSQASSSQNPLQTVGTDYGSPQGVKSGRFCKNFEVTEHGYLFVMASLVPTAFYSTGIDRHFFNSKVTDFGWPLLQGTGDQQIYTSELCKDPWNGAVGSLTFGYTQRYSHFKFMKDEVHGLLRDGKSLDSFALQRSFEFNSAGTATPTISYMFNEIPTNFLDQVSAASAAQSLYGYWADVYFKYYKVSTLSAYSIPTLGDLKNVHKEVIPLGGKRL